MAQIPVLPVLHSHQFLPTSSFSTSKLPNELLTIIFRFLSFADLKNALLVCKRWREVAEHPALWNKLELVHRVGKSLDCGLVEVLTMARLQWTPNPITVDKRAQDLVAQLVNFEDVHIFPRFVGEQHQAINGINEAILRAASDVEESKLKVLTLVGDESIDPAVLAVAQEKLTIKICNLRLISTKELNILAREMGLKRELIRELKEERRRLKNYGLSQLQH